MSTIRAFIAIEIPPDAQASLAQLQQQLKAEMPASLVRWTAISSIHLTLHFLGNISPDDAVITEHILTQVTATQPAFSLTLSRLGCFPNLRQPRVIWAGVDGETEALIRLQRRLGEQLQAGSGFTPERRPYSPHLTLGRVKQDRAQSRKAELGQILTAIQPSVGDLAEFSVSEVVLMKSELKPSGPVYTPLSHGHLASTA